jgi:hypothetical protein
MGEAPARIEPAPDDIDQEGLRGEFGRRRRQGSLLPATFEQMQLPGGDRHAHHGTWSPATAAAGEYDG